MGKLIKKWVNGIWVFYADVRDLPEPIPEKPEPEPEPEPEEQKETKKPEKKQVKE